MKEVLIVSVHLATRVTSNSSFDRDESYILLYHNSCLAQSDR
jgi:hypothetical protein